jgi:nitric oxide reductase NorD protein
VTGSATRLGPSVTAHLERLRRTDAAGHSRLVAEWPKLATRLTNDAERVELLELLGEASTGAPGTAAWLAPNLALLLERLDLAGLRRWIGTGLRLYYPDDPELLRRYFDMIDPAAKESLRAEAGGSPFSAKRAELQHYVAGFGFAAVELTSHRPGKLRDAPLRPAITDTGVRFPGYYLAIEGAARGDLYRAAAAHALAHLLFSPRHRPVGNRDSARVLARSLLEDARVERLMAQRYPGMHALWGRFHVATQANSGFAVAGLAARLARALHDPQYVDSNPWVSRGRELFESVSGRLEEIAAFDTIGKTLGEALGRMKLPADESPSGSEPAYRDDNNILWDFRAEDPTVQEQTGQLEERSSDELEEADDTLTVYESAAAIGERARTLYPEWDYAGEILREKWTTVIDFARGSDDRLAANAALLRGARQRRLRRLERVADHAIRLGRMHEGDELDLNAAIESIIHIRGRVAPDPRIFRRHGRRRRDAAAVLLLDLSVSTNDLIAGGYTSILEVEKRAATLVAEWLDPTRDRIAIHGFTSNGRDEVNYLHIKDFDEAFETPQKLCLREQTGRLSTRMGAALRHAATCLADERAEMKAILLLTDGAPSDIDVTDERYLVEDARHAVSMLSLRGMRTFCLTLDKHADPYVRRIFGARNYQIFDDENALPNKIKQILVQLLAS